MSHTTEIISAERIHGHYVVKVRCCGDPETDTQHSMALEVFADETKRVASMEDAHKLCAAHHELSKQADAALLAEVGSKLSHD